VPEDRGTTPLPRRAPGAGREPGARPVKRPVLSESDLQRMRAALDSAHAEADAPPAEPPAPRPRPAPDESEGTEPFPSTAQPELPASVPPTPRQALLEPPPAVPAARRSLVTEETGRQPHAADRPISATAPTAQPQIGPAQRAFAERQLDGPDHRNEATAPPTVPAPRPRPAWLRDHPSRGRAIIVGSAILTLVAILAGWSASLLTRHAGRARIRASAAARADVRDVAAAWVASQVGRAGLVSCDPAMCQALEASGVPATDLLVLRPGGADPLGSDVVVATAAVRKMVGRRVLTADAPATIASFGSGNRQISIRVIFPQGAAAYAAALRREIADRKLAGASLLQGPVTASVAARQQLREGQVDSRLLLTLGEVASQWPVTIMAFGDRGPSASPGIPFRSADLVVTDGKAGPGPAGQVQLMSVFLHQLGGYFASARLRTVHFAGGQDVVRIEFTVPGQFGLLGAR
jgi:hypothetical protein